MLVPLHHHFEAWNKNAPRNVSSSELVQHRLVDIVISKSSLSRFLSVTFVEAEWH